MGREDTPVAAVHGPIPGSSLHVDGRGGGPGRVEGAAGRDGGLRGGLRHRRVARLEGLREVFQEHFDLRQHAVGDSHAGRGGGRGGSSHFLGERRCRVAEVLCSHGLSVYLESIQGKGEDGAERYSFS